MNRTKGLHTGVVIPLPRLRTVVFFLLATLWLMPSASAQYPDIHAHRPRVYADSARLAWLAEQVTVPGECRDVFDGFIYAYNNWWINDPQLYLLGEDSTSWTWDWSSQWSGAEAFYTAFIHRVTGDALALKRCRFLAAQVIARIDSARFPMMEWYAKENLLRQMSDAGDVLLDWCYNDLPAELRARLARSLYVMNREFMNTFIYSSAGNSYVSSHNTWNTIFCNQNVLALHDADGLTAAEKDTVLLWHRALYDKLIYQFIPCWTYYRDDDGGWNWGAAYAMWSLVDQFQLFENMRIATGKNFFEDLPWVRGSINQYIYFMQPNDRCIHLGDGETGMSGDRVVYLHAHMFRDTRSMWMAQEWSRPSRMPNTNQKFAALLYRNFLLPEVEWPEPPLDWWADKVGLSVSRSSWKRDAAMVTFFNSPSKRAAHEHRDNNSFMIFRHAPLLIDAGYYDTYGGTHYRNYYQRTIAHNSIVVYDSSETYSCFGQPASNDGGQIESAALMNFDEIFLEKNQRGRWVQWSAGEDYQYSIADAQLSYDSAKLTFFRRRLLYHKPDRVLLLDHVHLNNTRARQRDAAWIAHMVRRPEISGALLASPVPGHIEQWDGNIYNTRNGGGWISVATLLPGNSTATLIGGEGYEYWVDGKNHPPLTVPDSNYYKPGAWRIEVRPAEIRDTLLFLHTMHIGDSLNEIPAGGTAIVSEYTVAADWGQTLYLFAAKAHTGRGWHALDSVAGGRIVEIFAADLRSGSYVVKIDGVISATGSADSNGILRSVIQLTPGFHRIVIEQSGTSVEDMAAPHIFKLYPNPVRDVLRVAAGDEPVEISVYSVDGKLLLPPEQRGAIAVGHLAPGVYFAKLRGHGGQRLIKFIKE